jgi:NAD+ kinase
MSKSNPAQFRHVALIGKYHASTGPGARDILLEIARYLEKAGLDVALEKDTAAYTGITGYTSLDVNGIGAHCDLGLVVGGDGTMLHGEYAEDRRSLMHGQVMRDGRCVFDALAMNDVVVNRGATAGMVELRVEVDGRFVANQRADGLIISSPTGSTAYAMSAGGPILHPAIAGWVMVPIAPHNLSNRPLVLADSAQIAIEIVAGRDASANFDMQSLASLLHGDRIMVRRSEHSVRFLHPMGWSYFDTLRRKLHWNEGGA